jgi:hypothetical protein
MPVTFTRVALAQILADQVEIRPDEAAAIVRSLWHARDVGPPDEPVAPGLEALKLDATGELFRVRAAGMASVDPFRSLNGREHGTAGPVKHLGDVLLQLLTPVEGAPADEASTALLAIAERASGRREATGLERLRPGRKAFRSVEAFLESLEPFSGLSDRHSLRNLFTRWRAKRGDALDLGHVPAAAGLSIEELSELFEVLGQKSPAVSRLRESGRPAAPDRSEASSSSDVVVLDGDALVVPETAAPPRALPAARLRPAPTPPPAPAEAIARALFGALDPSPAEGPAHSLRGFSLRRWLQMRRRAEPAIQTTRILI